MRLIDADKLLEWRHTFASDFGRRCAEMFISAIDQEETIEIPKWISCEERLPEESGEYLIMVETYKTVPYVEVDCFYAGVKEWSHRNAKILAWMPIPEFKRGE